MKDANFTKVLKKLRIMILEVVAAPKPMLVRQIGCSKILANQIKNNPIAKRLQRNNTVKMSSQCTA